MSNKYPQYKYTVFGDLDSNNVPKIDDISTGYMQDVTSDMLAPLRNYQNAFNNGDLTTCANILNANPKLKTMMWTAEKFNKVRDAIMAIETFFKNDVEKIITQIAARTVGINDSLAPGNTGADTNTWSINKINSTINSGASGAVDTAVNGLLKVYTVTLTSAGWTGSGPFTQAVTVNGITNKNYEIYTNIPENYSVANAKNYLKAFGCITFGKTETNKVTFQAYKKPSINISVRLREV